MKQKMVIKVQMTCDKCRSKAMKYAAVAGVTSVAIAGPEKDQVVVIGDGVDPVSLTRLLRKKVNGSASLVSVEEVKEKKETKHPIPIQCSSSYIYFPQYPMCEVVCDPNPTGCTFM